MPAPITCGREGREREDVAFSKRQPQEQTCLLHKDGRRLLPAAAAPRAPAEGKPIRRCGSPWPPSIRPGRPATCGVQSSGWLQAGPLSCRSAPLQYSRQYSMLEPQRQALGSASSVAAEPRQRPTPASAGAPGSGCSPPSCTRTVLRHAGDCCSRRSMRHSALTVRTSGRRSIFSARCKATMGGECEWTAA